MAFCGAKVMYKEMAAHIQRDFLSRSTKHATPKHALLADDVEIFEEEKKAACSLGVLPRGCWKFGAEGSESPIVENVNLKFPHTCYIVIVLKVFGGCCLAVPIASGREK